MKYLLILLFVLIAFLKTFSQHSYLHYKASGVSISYGIPVYQLPEGRYYKPLMFQYYYRFPLLKYWESFTFQFHVRPQYNIVFVTPKYHHEFGVNVFLEATFLLFPSVSVGGIIGSGPHYISYESKRQVNGFIFSDNFLATVRWKGVKNSLFETEFYGGLRHISNAGIKNPNWGINNWILGISVGKLF